MGNSKLNFFAKELDLKKGPGIVYGYYGNYLVSFAQNDKLIEAFVDAGVGIASEDTAEKLKAFIDSNVSVYGLNSNAITSTGVSVSFKPSNSKSFLEFFYLLMNQLVIMKVPGRDFCSNCGKEVGDKHNIIKLGFHAHTCDDECKTRILDSTASKNTVAKKGFPVLGFIGAFLFTAAAVAGAYYLETLNIYTVFVPFLYPVFALLGHMAFGGRRGAGRVFAVIFIPLLFFVLSSAGFLGYAVYQNWWDNGYVFNLSELIQTALRDLATNAALQKEFLIKRVGIGGGFLLLGYLFSLPSCFKKSVPYSAVLTSIKKDK